MEGGEEWSSKEMALALISSLHPDSLTQGCLIHHQQNSPIPGSGAFPGRRGQMTPSPKEPQAASWLPLDAAIVIPVPLLQREQFKIGLPVFFKAVYFYSK